MAASSMERRGLCPLSMRRQGEERRQIVEAMKQTAYDKGFDARYRYDGGDLGCLCGPGRTVFKLWSPEAQRVELSLYRDDTSGAYEVLPLSRGDRGVWQAAVEGNLHGTYYDYAVWTNGVCRSTADPYATACGRNGGRSMAVELSRTHPEGWDRDRPPAAQPEQIIYELHVKDFSFDPDSGVPAQYRGKFKAFSWRDERGRLPVCMKHLAGLGVTHVQLLPIFDFGSVDEGGSEEQFNWGYDPVNFNVPEGSYTTDPSDGAARVRECKEMIQALHQNGLRVVMDVVYNHTYYTDSWLERSAPGCYYRRRSNGALSNGSGCGNDIASGRAMVDNYIANSVLYWAKEYHIDGFRFDLMGLMTVELVNRIRRELDLVFGPGEKLLYGEPWRAGDSPMEPDTHPALMANLPLLNPGIAVFCDKIRDAVKGSCFDARGPGFVTGGHGMENAVLSSAAGWPEGAWEFNPRDPSQLINYVSCHDNYTLWDKLLLTITPGEVAPEAYAQPREEVLARNRLAAFICFTSLGTPYLQAGEEITLRGLLYGLLLQSGNDAAMVIACHTAGSEAQFVELMNQKAAQLGMKNSCFANPSGLNDKAHFSTAYDMALLARACLENQTVADICATPPITTSTST